MNRLKKQKMGNMVSVHKLKLSFVLIMIVGIKKASKQ